MTQFQVSLCKGGAVFTSVASLGLVLAGWRYTPATLMFACVAFTLLPEVFPVPNPEDRFERLKSTGSTRP